MERVKQARIDPGPVVYRHFVSSAQDEQLPLFRLYPRGYRLRQSWGGLHRRPVIREALSAQQRQCRAVAEDRDRIDVEPVSQEGRVDVAEVDRILQVAVVEVGQVRRGPIRPPRAGVPARKTGPAVPWSVPRWAFSATRRPNSEKSSTRTRSSSFFARRSARNPLTADEACGAGPGGDTPGRHGCRNHSGWCRRRGASDRARSGRGLCRAGRGAVPNRRSWASPTRANSRTSSRRSRVASIRRWISAVRSSPAGAGRWGGLRRGRGGTRRGPRPTAPTCLRAHRQGDGIGPDVARRETRVRVRDAAEPAGLGAGPRTPLCQISIERVCERLGSG